jgi:DNA-binding CsgD family transcriptional regulator
MGAREPDWRAIHEFSAEAIQAHSVDEILELLAYRADSLVPSDRGVALFKMKEGYPWCFRWPDFCDRRIHEFNTYYSRIVPVHFTGAEPVLGPVRWGNYHDSEYVTDFQGPLSLWCGVGASFTDTFSGTQYVAWIHRSGCAAVYRDSEVATLRTVCDQLTRLVSLRSEVEHLRSEHYFESELGPDAEVLSRREVEVARLICRRLSMREIAERLSISPRTVERHAFHIYTKLRVDNRKELAKLLLKEMQS